MTPVFDENYAPYKTKKSLDKSKLPHPIYEDDPQLVELYYRAWELAFDHVLERDDSPQPWYIDEAMKPDTIWIWDTCFMALFCRYAPDQFPGIESLNNFYYIMHEGKSAPYKVHHPDNPPLFAWVEWEYFKLTGNMKRLEWVVGEKEYLQKHFYFIENAKKFKLYKYAGVPLFATKKKHGFKWSGISSGMDNTPRGRNKYGRILWVDLVAQQALSALYIIKIGQLLKRTDIIEEFQTHYAKYSKLLNKYYWNQKDGIYYDINRRNPKLQVKVKTPAAFWPMLAEIMTKEQQKNLVQHLHDDNDLGGIIPWVSVSRDDIDFDPLGQYWRGGVWLPTAYMGTKALEKAEENGLANELAERLVLFMLRTYQEFEPSTIWEAYSPTKHEPSTYKRNARLVRPDFCGWSALGPISLFIENILGFHEIDAYNHKIKWNLRKKCKHGIQKLKFGEIYTDIVYENGEVSVNSNCEYNLEINRRIFKIKAGTQKFKFNFI